VPWFVESELATAGQPERRHQAEALVADLLRELDTLSAKLLDRRAHVLAHQIELVMGIFVGRVSGELGGRKGEDQPSAAGINRGETEHVAEEDPIRLRIRGENDRVNTGDHSPLKPRPLGPAP
jgi:hypothetical protein